MIQRILVCLSLLVPLAGCATVAKQSPLGALQSETQKIAPENQSPVMPAVESQLSAPITTIDPVTAIEPVGFTQHSSQSGCVACGQSANGCVSCGPSNCGPQPGVGPMHPGMLAYLYDPQEFLCDGGDVPPDARLSRSDVIMNLQPEDTVSHYTTDAGDIEFTASNRVCVYAPRFGVVRRITGAVSGEGAVGTVGVNTPVGPMGINYDLPRLVVRDVVEPVRSEFTHRIDSMRDRNRGVNIENVQQPLLAQDVLTVLAGIQLLSPSRLDDSEIALLEKHALAAVAWSIDESVEVAIQSIAPPVLTRDQKVDSLVVYDFPDAGRLNLIKLADRQHAAVGEKVKFMLRLQNVGDSPVKQVTIADNLTTRLAYVADSQTATVKATFTAAPNSDGSSKLQWELAEPMAVGDTVTIEFEVTVR